MLNLSDVRLDSRHFDDARDLLERRRTAPAQPTWSLSA